MKIFDVDFPEDTTMGEVVKELNSRGIYNDEFIIKVVKSLQISRIIEEQEYLTAQDLLNEVSGDVLTAEELVEEVNN